MTSMNVAEKIRARVKRGLRAWCADNRGVVALIFVFCIPAFVAAAGVAVDLSQAYNVKTRLSNALDKAALAAGSTNGSSEYIQQQVMNFFNANYPSGTLGTPHDVIVSLANGMVDVQASSTVHTVFMGIFGQPTLEVNAETIVKREVSGLELILVMDNTGSMAQTAGGSTSKIDAAKTAANTLFDILYGPSSSVPTLFIGVVPFSQDVNIGTANDSWTTSDSYNWGPTSWMGCVEARESSGRDVTDDPPSDALFPKYYSPCDSSNTWYESKGSEIARQGDFSANSDWTQKSWTINSGRASITGENIASNGDFSSDTGWGTGSDWTVTGGVLSKSTSRSSASISTTPATDLVSGVTYNVTYTVVTRSAGSVKISIGGASGTSRSAPGTYSQNITASSGSTISFSTSNGFKGTIDDVSVVALGSTLSESPSSSLSRYNDYSVTYTIANISSGSVHSTIGGASGSSESATGTYDEIVRASSGSTIGLVASSDFVGSVDDFSVRTLTQCGSGPDYVYQSPLDTTTQGPNMYCAQPLQSMTSDKATLEAAVASMAPAGDTMINLGMAWGWRMLSPRWRGVWTGFMSDNNLPEDYDTPSMTKAVILMTDGDNTFINGVYHAYGYLSEGRIGTTSASTATTKLNTLTLDVCSSLKSHDVLIYTLALGTSFTSTSLNMLKSCATGPAYFFNSPTTADLENNFTTIANQLNSLHITH